MARTDRLDRPQPGGCEIYQSATRLVVAPAPGAFTPAPALLEPAGPVAIEQGQVVGHIDGTEGPVAITSPFAGALDRLIAWPNERLQKHARVLAMRTVA